MWLYHQVWSSSGTSTVFKNHSEEFFCSSKEVLGKGGCGTSMVHFWSNDPEENVFFSYNTKIRMQPHTSIRQVPLVSQWFRVTLWIHILCLVMMRSPERMHLGADYFQLLFSYFRRSPWLCNDSAVHVAENSKYQSRFIKQVLCVLAAPVSSGSTPEHPDKNMKRSPNYSSKTGIKCSF